MWFLIGSVAILALIMVAALVSDLRRRAKLRALGEAPLGRGIEDAARRGRAGIDVRGNHTNGVLNRGTYDLGP